tara:strand:- start:920 stop:1414 length:495 start_codon:yes stop_codon:yes gene_type:complete
MNNINNLSSEDKSYLAGFLDGDGSIHSQLIKSKTKYGYHPRVSVVFYQKTSRHWFLMDLQKMIGFGVLRKRNDGMSELTITGFTPVKNILSLISPFLKLKKPLSLLVLNIIEEYKRVTSIASFLEVCKKIDETARYTDSKTRKNTYFSVKNYLDSPVETEESNL